jgi:ubiquitin-protein ligase
MLRKRLRREIQECGNDPTREIRVKDPGFSEFPVTMIVTIKNVPGPISREKKIASRYDHRMRIDISEEYPYQKPTVRFLSDIFHPNIAPPERGGWVCIKLLDNWSLSSNLAGLLKGIETLLMNPNPRSPYRDEITLKAARYFLKNPYCPPNIVDKHQNI